MTKETGKIHFIITGGTIDSFYDGTIDAVRPNEKSVIPYYIETLKLYEEAEYTEFCMKDSRELDMNDREGILETVEKTEASHIIITHGTYTMPDTARYLSANMAEVSDKVIILTGSMIPMAGFTGSDGPFNLGFSLGMIKNVDPGVYICMNGRLFTHEEVAKDISEGRFYSVFKEKETFFGRSNPKVDEKLSKV